MHRHEPLYFTSCNVSFDAFTVSQVLTDNDMNDGLSSHLAH
jgi:hypothetical protein